MENRLTKRKLKNHWHYNWWKYLVIVCLSCLGVDLVYTMTAYRPPENKRIEMYICSGYVEAAALEKDLWPEFVAAAPDQEELVIINIDMMSGEPYSNMQFTTYVGAQQGDICLMPNSQVKRLTAGEGADSIFMELTPYVESGVIDVEGVDLQAGVMADSMGGTGLYAIPADSLYGLYEFYCTPEDCSLVVFGYTGNADNAALMIDLLFDLYQTDEPQHAEGQDEETAQSGTVLFH